MTRGEIVYSNIDHEYTLSAENVKNSGSFHQHAAWDFCGYVYYDKLKGVFIEEVWVYNTLKEIHSDKDLESLITGVINDYGEA